MRSKQVVSLLFTSILFLVLSGILVNAEPAYEVSIDLSDTSISPEDYLNFSLSIIGGGVCRQGVLFLHAEGLIPSCDNKVFGYQNGTGGWVIVDAVRDNQVDCIYEDSITYHPATCNDELGFLQFNFDTPGLFDDNNSHLLKGWFGATTLEEASGGDYRIKAEFICNDEEHWYTFVGENQYHVTSTYERLQVFFESFSLAIAIFAGVIIVLWEKKIKDYLKNVWEKIINKRKEISENKIDTKE